NLVSEAMAQVSSPTGVFKEMNSASGGVLTLSEGEADIACVHNITSVPLKILSMDEMYGQGISVTPGPECTADDNSGSGCSVDQVLDPDDVCGVTLQPYLPPS
ncbi:MAG: hypothetical protein M0R02_16160, partial [Bacteroidales bacterium]|nr:hypothetical protein [Bacteroidales bacterium]